MFDRFTERARQVMTLARQEAQKLSNDYIGTEHILFGLVHEGSGVGAQVLKNLGVDLRKVRAEVERIVEQGTSPASGSQLPLTPRGERVLELALFESQSLGHDYVGTEHLLLGLVGEGDGAAARVLQDLGVRSERARDEVVELIGRESARTDWAMVARMRDRAEELVAAGLPWARTLVVFELLPLPARWSYRISVSLVPRSGRGDAVSMTVPGGPLKDLEKDLPGLIDSLVKSIQGENGVAGDDSITA